MFPLSLIRGSVRQRSKVSVLREPAFALLTRIQHADPADQISAMFLAATVMAQATGLDPHEEVSRSVRMMDDAEADHTVHVQAIRDYAVNELQRIGDGQ